MERTIVTRKVYKIMNVNTNQVLGGVVKIPNISLSRSRERKILEEIKSEFPAGSKIEDFCLVSCFNETEKYTISEEEFLKHATKSAAVTYEGKEGNFEFLFEEEDLKK